MWPHSWFALVAPPTANATRRSRCSSSRRLFPSFLPPWLRHALLLVVLIGAGIAAMFLVGGSSKATEAAVTYSSEEVAFVRLLNDYRTSRGLRPLLVSDRLSQAGDRHSSDMGTYGFVDHYTTGGSDWFEDGASPWERMSASGYTYRTLLGENVGAGYSTAAAVLAAWVASPAHNAVMLNPAYLVLGVSQVKVEESPFGYYWTTDFGGYADTTARSIDALSPASKGS